MRRSNSLLALFIVILLILTPLVSAFNFEQSLNRYSYVKNNPYTYVDRDGHVPLLLSSLIGAIAGAGLNMITQIWNGASMFDGSMDWGEVGKSAGIGAGAGMAGGVSWTVGSATGMTTGIISGASWGAVSGLISTTSGQMTYNILEGKNINDNILNKNLVYGTITGALIGGVAGAYSPSVVGTTYNTIKPTQNSVNPFIVESKLMQIRFAQLKMGDYPKIRLSSFETLGDYTTDGHHSFVAYSKLKMYPKVVSKADFTDADANLFPGVGKYKDWSQIKYKLGEPK